MLGPLAKAQSQVLQAAIPFDFRIGDRHYDAAKYTIVQVGQSHYAVQGPNGTGQLVAAMIPEPPRRDGKRMLVFQCYENDCALRSVWLEGKAFSLPKKQWQPDAKVQAAARPGRQTIIAMK